MSDHASTCGVCGEEGVEGVSHEVVGAMKTRVRVGGGVGRTTKEITTWTPRGVFQVFVCADCVSKLHKQLKAASVRRLLIGIVLIVLGGLLGRKIVPSNQTTDDYLLRMLGLLLPMVPGLWVLRKGFVAGLSAIFRNDQLYSEGMAKGYVIRKLQEADAAPAPASGEMLMGFEAFTTEEWEAKRNYR